MRRRGLAAALGTGALLAGAGSAWAAWTPEGSPYPTGAAPYSINVADFNADGRPDVATPNGTPANLTVYLRQPGGFVQESGSPFALDGGPSTAVVADFNGDGFKDLAVGIFVGNIGVDLMLRQAAGGFERLGIPVAGGVSGIATGSFDSDGQPDLAVSRQGSNQVSILLGRNNSFLTVGTYDTGAQPGPVAVGDFNGDGHDDVGVVNTGGSSVTVLLGNGNGGFTAEAAVPTSVKPAGIVAADFTGDGRADMAVTNYTDGTVSVFDRNAANTGFDAEAPIAVSANPVGISAADLDRDGRLDLAVAANSGAVDVLRRVAGGFIRDPAIALPGTQNGVAAGDFDGDGRADLAVSDSTNNRFSALLNPAPAATPTPTPTPTPTALPPPVAGKTVNAARKSGKVRFRRPGSKKFVTLTAAAQIPVGSVIDTRHGRIAITAAQGKGRTATADFFAGLFKLTQTRGAKPATTLTLTERLSCPKRHKASAAAKKPKSRRLWGSGHGRFTTKGAYSAATVRGTKWLVQDRCTSTLTRVASGVVSVRDRVKRKTVILRAGKRYVARRRG